MGYVSFQRRLIRIGDVGLPTRVYMSTDSVPPAFTPTYRTAARQRVHGPAGIPVVVLVLENRYGIGTGSPGRANGPGASPRAHPGHPPHHHPDTYTGTDTTVPCTLALTALRGCTGWGRAGTSTPCGRCRGRGRERQAARGRCRRRHAAACRSASSRCKPGAIRQRRPWP